MQEKHEQKEEPQLCVVCNRFYGSSSRDNMCSTCYRIHLKMQPGDKTSEENKLSPSATPPTVEEAKYVPSEDQQKQVSIGLLIYLRRIPQDAGSAKLKWGIWALSASAVQFFVLYIGTLINMNAHIILRKRE